MRDGMYRPLKPLETFILQKLLSVDVEGIGLLQNQLEFASARVLDEYGSLQIRIDGAPKSGFLDGPLIYAKQKDLDTTDDFAPHINILLFIKNGLLDRLEIYKDNLGRILGSINPKEFNELLVDKRRFPAAPVP
jgi:hypothetical protein